LPPPNRHLRDLGGDPMGPRDRRAISTSPQAARELCTSGAEMNGEDGGDRTDASGSPVPSISESGAPRYRVRRRTEYHFVPRERVGCAEGRGASGGERDRGSLFRVLSELGELYGACPLSGECPESGRLEEWVGSGGGRNRLAVVGDERVVQRRRASESLTRPRGAANSGRTCRNSRGSTPPAA